MFALTVKRMGRPGRHAEPSVAEVEDRFVLPRPLRRVARFLISLGSGRIHIPNHVGTVSALGFLAVTGLYGMSLGGHTEAVAQATTAAAGFAIEDVKVSGNSETSEIEILQLLGLDGTTSLVALRGMGLTRATALTKLLNLTSNVASVLFFALGGKIVWTLGLAIACGAMIGNYLGSHTAMRFGAKVIRPLLVILSLGLTAKLLWQYFAA